MKKETTKSKYESPIIYEHGDVSEITLQGSLANRDTPSGNDNSAYGPPNS